MIFQFTSDDVNDSTFCWLGGALFTITMQFFHCQFRFQIQIHCSSPGKAKLNIFFVPTQPNDGILLSLSFGCFYFRVYSFEWHPENECLWLLFFWEAEFDQRHVLWLDGLPNLVPTRRAGRYHRVNACSCCVAIWGGSCVNYFGRKNFNAIVDTHRIFGIFIYILHCFNLVTSLLRH